MEFKHKNILITGASSGIGEEFAKQFHALGANLILVARRLEKLNQISEAMNIGRAGSARVLAADLTNTEQINSVTDYIKNNHIDILVNNAGFGSLGYFDEIDLVHEVKMVALNITSTLQTLHAVIPQMKQRKNGAIISLASIAAFQPMPFMSTYAATKVFNFYHSLGLRRELSDFNIRVLTVCPGPTATEFFGAAHLSGMAKEMSRDKASDVVQESINALIRNKSYVVTGLKSKFIAFATTFFPFSLSTWLIKQILKNMKKVE